MTPEPPDEPMVCEHGTAADDACPWCAEDAGQLRLELPPTAVRRIDVVAEL